MHRRLDNGLNTASDSPIDRLPESRNASIYREGHSFETNNKNNIKDAHLNEMKLYKSIKTLMWNHLYALHLSITALQQALS